MGFRVKVAPGVRVSTSSRGLRASTGGGAVSAYASLGARRGRPSAVGRSSVAAHEAELRAGTGLDGVDAARRAQAAFERQLDAYREQFPPIEKPVADVQRIDAEAHVLAAQLEAVARISHLRPRRRRAARDAAAAAARAEAEREQAEAVRAQAAHQAEIDVAWQRLIGNDPAVVLQALEEAFEDNEVPAAPIDCADGWASVLLRCPPLDGIVPTHMPITTPAGRETVRAYAATRRNDLYLAALLSRAYATVAETFAIAPGVAGVTVLTVSVGRGELTPIYCAEVTREEFAAGAWLSDGAPCPAPRRLLNLRGRVREVAALDLAAESQLSDVVRRLARDLGVTVSPETKLTAPRGPAASAGGT